jgi:hypothetical protein
MKSQIKIIDDYLVNEIRSIDENWDRKIFRLKFLSLFNVIYNMIYYKGKKTAYQGIREMIAKKFPKDADEE